MLDINVDDEIKDIYDRVKVVGGQDQVMATLLLALKVESLEKAVKKATKEILEYLVRVTDHDSKAIRVTDKSKGG